MPSPGLHSPAVYIPKRRLTGETVAAAFGGKPGKGSRAVAAFDEDVVTMAIAAGERAIAGGGDGAGSIGAVFLATTSAPLAEKSAASLVAAGLGLGGVAATDVGGGLAAGLAALAAACDAVASGRVPAALAVAAERLTEAPGTAAELRVGDGAAAVVVTASGGCLTVRGRHAAADPLATQWRRAGEPFRRATDARFAAEAGAARLVPAALGAACEAAGWTSADLGAAAAATLDARAGAGLLAAAGVGQTAARADTLQPAVGHLGCAHPLALLARLAEGAAPGARLGLVAGGDGVDAWCFEVTAPIDATRAAAAEREGEPLAHYGAYLRGRGLLPAAPGVPMEPFTSASMLAREADAWWRWQGRACEGCRTVLVLPTPACPHCGAERTRPVALGRVGTVFTATAEHYVPSPEPPTGMVVIDLEGGGRATVQWAGGAGPLPAIGDRVRLVLRKYHEADGWPHYWWKALPE